VTCRLSGTETIADLVAYRVGRYRVGDQGLVSDDADADERFSRIAITRTVGCGLTASAALHM
jgi:hypothetical protein